MDLKSIWDDGKKVKALTGLKKDELDEIASLFLNQIKRKEASRGRPRKLDDKNLLLLLLTQYKHNMTFDFLAVVFGMDLSNVKRWTDRLESVLQDVLKKKNYHHLIPTVPRKTQEEDYSLADLYSSMVRNNP